MSLSKLNGRRNKQRSASTSRATKELPPWHWAYTVAEFPGKKKATLQEPRK